MKILHTSDWHLGLLLYGASREDAHQHMLDQMAEIVRERKPDVFLLSGDVFDTAQPSASSQRLLADALTHLHDAHPAMHIVCISGNHDSSSKHEIFELPWRALNVHMIGSIGRESPLEDYVLEFPGVGFVVAVPHAPDRFMPEDVFVKLSRIVEARNAGRNLPVALMAHMAVENCDRRGHTSAFDDEYVGGLACQKLDVFGDGYDYVALGHIHHVQALDEKKSVWYSGSPVPVSFDEVYPGSRHGILSAEISRHGDAVRTEFIPVENIHPLVNLPAEGAASWEDVKKLLREFSSDVPTFIRLNVELEADGSLPPTALAEAQELVGPRHQLTPINCSRKKSENQKEGPTSYTVDEFKKFTLLEVAKMWLGEHPDEGTFDKELLAQMLRDVQDRMHEKENK